MSDQFHNIEEENEDFTGKIQLHTNFRKNTKYVDEFMQKQIRKNRKRVLVKYSALAAILLIISIPSYLLYNHIITDPQPAKVKGESVQKPVQQQQAPVIEAKEVLDIVVCHPINSEDADRIANKIIDNFGNISFNLFTGKEIIYTNNSINIKQELLVGLFKANDIKPKELGNIFKTFIYHTDNSKIVHKLVIIDNLTDVSKVVNKEIITLDDLNHLNKKYKSVIYLKNNKKFNETDKQFRQSINLNKQIIEY